MKTQPTLPIVRRKLLNWFRRNRRDLPWRRTHDPYLIAVSEVMLQQTQVDRVIPKFLAWRRAWPTTKSLAQAPLADVLQAWSGLGYNSRAKRLRDAARLVTEQFDGKWPMTIDALESLPGFGPYTARAVASFAFQRDVGVTDTNVRRVISRIFFGMKIPVAQDLEDVVQAIVPRGKSADWNAALMDFGSAVCTSRSPKCLDCPLQKNCRAYPTILQQEAPSRTRSSVRFQETDRYWRGEMIRQVLKHSTLSQAQLQRTVHLQGLTDRLRSKRLMHDLIEEGLLKIRGKMVSIAS